MTFKEEIEYLKHLSNVRDSIEDIEDERRSEMNKKIMLLSGLLNDKINDKDNVGRNSIIERVIDYCIELEESKSLLRFINKRKPNKDYKELGLYNQTMIKKMKLSKEEEKRRFKKIGWLIQQMTFDKISIFEDIDNPISKEDLEYLTTSINNK